MSCDRFRYWLPTWEFDPGVSGADITATVSPQVRKHTHIHTHKHIHTHTHGANPPRAREYYSALYSVVLIPPLSRSSSLCGIQFPSRYDSVPHTLLSNRRYSRALSLSPPPIINTHTYTLTRTDTQTHTRTYTRTGARTHRQTRRHTETNTGTNVNTHIHTQALTCTYTRQVKPKPFVNLALGSNAKQVTYATKMIFPCYVNVLEILAQR